MGQQIIKQTLVDGKPIVIDGVECKPGLYSVWSSIVDNFVFINGTREELIEFYVREAMEHARRDTALRIDRADSQGGSGHRPFTKTFEEAVKWAVEVHGDSALEEDDNE